MAAGTVLSEDDLPPFNLRAVGCHKRVATRCTRQLRSLHLHQEPRQVLHAARGRHPINGTLLGSCNFEWALRSTSDQRIVIAQPLLAVFTDADVYAAEGTDQADRISAVFQGMRYPHPPLFAGKMQRAASNFFLLGYGHSCADRVDG